MKKVIAVLVLLGTVAIPNSTEAQDNWRVVATGDSILAMTYEIDAPGGVILTTDRWMNMEYGRNAYTAGMIPQASTASIWPLMLQRSQAGGWIIIQDNAIDVSLFGWQALMQKIADETPDDRCLLGILPGTQIEHLKADVAAKATAMSQAFQTHPCRRFVYWNHYVRDNPQNVPDGQHPNLAGQIWLYNEVEKWI